MNFKEICPDIAVSFSEFSGLLARQKRCVLSGGYGMHDLCVIE
jgi:hypothetical protein